VRHDKCTRVGSLGAVEWLDEHANAAHCRRVNLGRSEIVEVRLHVLVRVIPYAIQPRLVNSGIGFPSYVGYDESEDAPEVSDPKTCCIESLSSCACILLPRKGICQAS
jgi:hypothetical protein